jgi:TonB family protein
MRAKARITSIVTFLLLLSPITYIRAQNEGTVDDKDTTVTHFEELQYPTFARAAHVEGVVVIRVALDDKGGVAQAVTISGNRALVGDCLANARKWKFEPNPRKSAVIVYDFTLKNASCGAASSFFIFRGKNIAEITGCAAPVEPTR